MSCPGGKALQPPKAAVLGSPSGATGLTESYCVKLPIGLNLVGRPDAYCLTACCLKMIRSLGPAGCKVQK